MTEETHDRAPRAAEPPWGPKPSRGPMRGVISGYRFYNSDLGRWINRDPIGERGGDNLYIINFNSCVNLVDILGNLILLPPVEYDDITCSYTGDSKIKTKKREKRSGSVPTNPIDFFRWLNAEKISTTTWKCYCEKECCNLSRGKIEYRDVLQFPMMTRPTSYKDFKIAAKDAAMALYSIVTSITSDHSDKSQQSLIGAIGDVLGVALDLSLDDWLDEVNSGNAEEVWQVVHDHEVAEFRAECKKKCESKK